MTAIGRALYRLFVAGSIEKIVTHISLLGAAILLVFTLAKTHGLDLSFAFF
jgi:hypothetical protein